MNFNGGVAIVELFDENKSKYGLIDIKGYEIIPVKYDHICRLSEEKNKYFLVLDGKCGVVDVNDVMIKEWE